MTAVSTADGIKYGFKLMGYQLLVTVVGGGIALVGFFLTSAFGIAAVDNGSAGGGLLAILIGGVFLLAGVAVWLAGMAGTTYKVVADAVEAGTESASLGRGRAPASGTPQRPSGREARTGRGGSSSGSASADAGPTGASPESRSGSGQSSSTDSSRGAGSASTSERSSRAGSSVRTSRRDSASSQSGERGSGDRGGSSGKRGASDRGGSSGSGSSRSGGSRRRNDE